MTEDIKNELNHSLRILEEFIQNSNNIDSIERAATVMLTTLNKGGKIISCGNGGSMSDAMHFAEELTGRYRDSRDPLPAVAISDPGYISCVANDFGYDKVFERFVEAFAKPEDCLLVISTSGNSANVINAAQKGKELGTKVIGLTGKDGGELKNYLDVEIRAPQAKYADRVQEIHIKVIHTLIYLIEQNIANG